ncbi:VOC family protein [Methylobacterium nigriterrae]|uniref:VOC family protein n=1 Tax=Methylobacterium nigriterrae TaxID=3127512 RepID=UPI0030135738
MSYRCDHIHLRSKDAVAAAAFYVETLGAREIRRDGSSVASRVTIDLGGLILFIEQAPEGLGASPEPPRLGIEHIGLAVEDIEATMNRLLQTQHAGATLLRTHPGIRAGLA